jgi:hypothetical protein
MILPKYGHSRTRGLSAHQRDILDSTLRSVPPEVRSQLSEQLHARLRRAGFGGRPSDQIFEAAMKATLTGVLSPREEDE